MGGITPKRRVQSEPISELTKVTDPIKVEDTGGTQISPATEDTLDKLAPTGTGDGRKTVTAAGTAEPLAASTPCKLVIITAETDNTDYVVVGSSTVVAALATRRGTPLAAGDSTTIQIDDLADIYVDAVVSGEGVTYTYLT